MSLVQGVDKGICWICKKEFIGYCKPCFDKYYDDEK